MAVILYVKKRKHHHSSLQVVPSSCGNAVIIQGLESLRTLVLQIWTCSDTNWKKMKWTLRQNECANHPALRLLAVRYPFFHGHYRPLWEACMSFLTRRSRIEIKNLSNVVRCLKCILNCNPDYNQPFFLLNLLVICLGFLKLYWNTLTFFPMYNVTLF